jgi:hypothetical protein
VTLVFSDFDATFGEGFEMRFPAVAMALKKWPKSDDDIRVIAKFVSYESEKEQPVHQFIYNLYNARYVPENGENNKQVKERALSEVLDVLLLISRGDKRKFDNFSKGLLAFMAGSPKYDDVHRCILSVPFANAAIMTASMQSFVSQRKKRFDPPHTSPPEPD